MIRLIALDLDGTVLGLDGRPSRQAEEAIHAALARGVHVMLATGRTYTSGASYARELGLPPGPLIAYNGAEAREYPDGGMLLEQPVPMAEARPVIAFCRQHGLYLHIYQDDMCYASHRTAWTGAYRRITGVLPAKIGDLSEVMRKSTPKLLVMGTDAELQSAERGLVELLGERVCLTRSFSFMLEVTHPLATKGRALQWVADRLGLDRSEVMAVGDGQNDVEMIRWAGTGVAINHCGTLVEAAADWVTPGGVGTGVAEAIQRFVLA